MAEVSQQLFLGNEQVFGFYDDKWTGINSYNDGPVIPVNPVTTGLVLELNNSIVSYPGSGDAWYDVSGNGYVFNQTGSATWGGSSVGWNLNGSTQYLWNNDVSLPNQWSGAIADSLTIFVDADIKRTNAEGTLYGNWMATPQKILFEVNNGGTIERAVKSTTTIYGGNTTGTITTGRKIMTMTVSGSTAYVFANDVQVSGTLATFGNWTTQTPDTYLGGREFPASTLYGPLSGSIKAVVAYNRALSATERTDVYDYLLSL